WMAAILGVIPINPGRFIHRGLVVRHRLRVQFRQRQHSETPPFISGRNQQRPRRWPAYCKCTVTFRGFFFLPGLREVAGASVWAVIGAGANAKRRREERIAKQRLAESMRLLTEPGTK